MAKNKFLLPLLLISVNILFGQSKENSANNLFFKINPFSLFDPLTPGIQIGPEYKFHRKWAIEVCYGIPWYIGKNKVNNDSDFHNNKKVKLELKRFFGKHSNYLSGEFFYTNNSFNSFNSWYTDNSGSYFYNNALYKKYIQGFAIKVGNISKVSKKIFVDFFISVGIRHVKTTVYSSNAVPGMPPFRDWVSPAHPIGTKITPHMAYAAKFSYQIF